MMRVLVLLACIAAAASVTVERCAWGPSYWCSDLRIAKQCGAVDHCISTVWKKQRLDGVHSSETCALCQMVVGKIKEELKTIPKEEITAMVAKMCAILPAAEKATCKNLVNEYMPEIIQLLTSELDPKAVCAALTLCSGFQDPLHHVVKEAAKTLVPRLHGEMECSLCKEAIGELRQLAEDKQIQTTIETFLETKVCPLLGVENATCIEYVKLYAPVVFEIAANELDPTTVCTALKLCVSKSRPAHLIRVSLSKAPTRIVSFKPASTKPLKASPLCPLCEFVMMEIDQMLKRKRSEEAITAALEKVCSLLPQSISQECKTFVSQYAPAIIELLIQEIDPEMVCTMMGLCGNSKFTLLPKANDLKCDVCQELINYINEFLNENSTVAEIEAVLDKVCDLLPATLKDQCTSMVQQYGPVLVQLLKELDDPLKICQEIKMCPSLRALLRPQSTLPLLGAKECTWGPSYWCASKENAAKCKAEKHCMKHVWN